MVSISATTLDQLVKLTKLDRKNIHLILDTYPELVNNDPATLDVNNLADLINDNKFDLVTSLNKYRWWNYD